MSCAVLLERMGLYVVLGGANGPGDAGNCRAVSCPLKTRAKSWCSTRCLPVRPLPVQQR